MRISDWSSDVCSSDLSAARALLPGDLRRQGVVRIMRPFSGVLRRRRWPAAGTKSGVSTKMAEQAPEVGLGRTSVVEGKSVSVRVDLGGSSISNKKNHAYRSIQNQQHQKKIRKK